MPSEYSLIILIFEISFDFWFKVGLRIVSGFCLGLSCIFIVECPMDCPVECPVDFPWDKKKNPSSDLLQPKLGFFI